MRICVRLGRVPAASQARRFVFAAAAAAAAVMLLPACSGAGSAGASSPASRTPTPSDTASPGRPGPGRSGPGRPASGKGAIGVLGSYQVGQRSITFTEPPHAGPTGQPLGFRTLRTQIRYPLATRYPSARPARGPLPMIVFAPGFMQCGDPYARMLHAWASAGYVVVVVNFPRSDCKVGSAATEADMVNQPRDMSYVITRMLALSAAAHGLFAGRLDPGEIAITGQSDGGDTVAAIAANTCCADHRVVAVASLSGAEWPPMPGSYFTRPPVPMLFVQGTADTINRPGCSVAMYHADSAHERYYLDLLGASHMVPYWGANQYERIVARVTLGFFDRYVLGQAAGGSAMRRAGNVSGLAALYSRGTGQLPAGPCNN